MKTYRLIRKEFKAINMDTIHGVIQGDRHDLFKSDTKTKKDSISIYVGDTLISVLECSKIEEVTEKFKKASDKTYNIYLINE